MMLTRFVFVVGLLIGTGAIAAEGMIVVESHHNYDDTGSRFISTLESKGMKIFADIDHRAGAASIGEDLRPTRTIVFGNPRLGTALMSCNQTVAIDLPMKAVVWQDAEGKVWLGYNDPAFLDHRHGLPGCEKPLAKATGAQANFAKAATSP
ncbi:MAG: DUF302 domain-containing protein [Chromatiales bacterium]|nr:DUF302 domain-containing protein [Chromatiales bacterium]